MSVGQFHQALHVMAVRAPACARTRQAGLALIIVLWVVVLLTVIVSSFVYSARTNTQLAGNWVSRVSAQGMADAGVYRGVFELLRRDNLADRWQPDGRTHEFELNGAAIRVTMLDETAFIDINAVQDKLLLGLFESVGIDPDQSQALVDAILDWRDGDDLPRPAGAERDEYQAAGLKHLPANANFRTLDEIKQVYGMTPDLFARLAPAITVYSRMPGFSSTLAPRQVLLAIPGVTAAEVDDFMALRRENLDTGVAPPAFPPATAYAAGRSGMIYNVRSEAALADGTVFVRKAVVRLKNDPKHPFGFLDWTEGRP